MHWNKTKTILSGNQMLHFLTDINNQVNIYTTFQSLMLYKNTIKAVILCYITILLLQNNCFIYFNIYLKWCISGMSKLNCQQSLLQSSVSHDPSEIILICTFFIFTYILSMMKTVVLLNSFVGIMIFFPKNLWWIESSRLCNKIIISQIKTDLYLRYNYFVTL